MAYLDDLEKIFNVVVVPIIPTAAFSDVKERVKTLEGSQSFDIFLANKDKLVSKIPKLKQLSQLLKGRQTPPEDTDWIVSWFERMQFIDISEIHSIPESFKDITLIVHKIMLLYTINNVGVIVHGSFAAHLLDNRIRYADLDITCLQDDLVFLTSLLLYLFLGVHTHILSIPFIINHRQLRIDGDKTSISDALKIDRLTASLSQSQPIRIAKDILINTQHAVTQFLNYFKMLHLHDRRRRIRHYKHNQFMVLNAIYQEMLYQIDMKHEQMMKVIPYTIQIDASVNSMLIAKLGYMKLNFTIVFHTGYQDHEFIPALRSMLGVSDSNREMVVFNQLCSLFPEQCVEVVSLQDTVLHINISRNEVYKVLTNQELITGESNEIIIDSYSVLNLLAIVGLHYFFTRRASTKTVEPFVRIISTIIHFCQRMKETPQEMLYNRTKNNGDHIVRTIFSKRRYISSKSNEYPIVVYTLPANTLEMKVKESLLIEDYHRQYK